VPLLRAAGRGAECARGLSLHGAGDHVHLVLAAQRGWVLVTHNWKDFRLLNNAWHQWPREWWKGQPGRRSRFMRILQRLVPAYPQHAGILVLDHGAPQALADAIGGWELRDQIGTGELWRWHRRAWEHVPPLSERLG
jgi:hypothetical protein